MDQIHTQKKRQFPGIMNFLCCSWLRISLADATWWRKDKADQVILPATGIVFLFFFLEEQVESHWIAGALLFSTAGLATIMFLQVWTFTADLISPAALVYRLWCTRLCQWPRMNLRKKKSPPSHTSALMRMDFFFCMFFSLCSERVNLIVLHSHIPNWKHQSVQRASSLPLWHLEYVFTKSSRWYEISKRMDGLLVETPTVVAVWAALIRFLSDAFLGPAASDERRHISPWPTDTSTTTSLLWAGEEEGTDEVEHHEIKGRWRQAGEWTELCLLRWPGREKDGFYLPRHLCVTLTSPLCQRPASCFVRQVEIRATV